MALDFSGNTGSDYYTITADASMDLPDGDWCVSFKYNISSNTGSSFRFPVAWGGLDAAHCFNIYTAEASQGDATRVNNWAVNSLDAGFDTCHDQANWLAGDANDYSTSGDWEVVFVVRVGTTVYVYTAPLGGSPTNQGEHNNTAFDAVENNATIYLGCYQGTSWPYESLFADFFIMHDSLSTEEMEAIAHGVPVSQLNKDLRCWLPFKSNPSTEIDLSGNGNDATKNGTPGSAEHFPTLWGRPNLAIVTPAAAGGITGTLAETLDNDTSAANGEIESSGSVSETADNFTSSIEGGIYGTGSVAETAEDFTSAADGGIYGTGSLAETDEDETLSSNGIVGVITGTLAVTEAEDTINASGIVGVLAYSNMMDAILGKTGGPTINGGLLSYYQANGATSTDVMDAEKEFLLAQGATDAPLADMWKEYLEGLGHSGHLNDMLFDFWST